MKLATLRANEDTYLAAERDGRWMPIEATSHGRLSDVIDYLLLADGQRADLAAKVAAAPENAFVTVPDVAWAAPTKRAGKIVCLGLNYRERREETDQPPDATHATVFLRANTSLIAHDQLIRCLAVSVALDYVGELVAIAGRRTRYAIPASALDAIAGYSVFNDASIRDFQTRGSRWTLGKNFDDIGAFGPWMVTADELPSGAAGLVLTVRLNGDVVQSANTDEMIHEVRDVVVLASQVMTLEPRDLLVLGTPSGVDACIHHSPW